MAHRRLLEIRVLGPVEVEVAGRPIVLGSRRQQALLALLAIHAGTVVSVSQIADALWEDDPGDAVANTVQTHVSRLRRSLDVGREAIVTRPTGYLLLVDRHALDARRFEGLCRDAQETMTDEPGEAVELLDRALALWRGQAYAPFTEGFARADATRLEELRATAQEQRALLALTTGALDEAVVRASGLAREHPLRERPVDILMRALHRVGRTADALAEYRRHRQLLDAELGLEPSVALQALEQRILRDDLPAPPTRRIAAATEMSRSPPARPPWPPSELIGREPDLDWIRRTLDRTRTVTVSGTGGVGKTRLVLEVAHEYERAGSSVCWVDLTVVRPGGVVEAIAQAAAAEVAHAEDRMRRLCGLLSARRGLLCLDNAEHVLDEVAEFVECLAASRSDLAILVTSRERLGLDTEVVRPLAPLPLPEGPDESNPAVQLFLRRWQRPEEEVDAADAARVSHLVRRLDGLPLAIELAAAQASALGLRMVSERLGTRLDLLAGGRRTSDPRHRTMRAVVAWSHGLLAPDEAELFRRLAVFPGPFTIDQAEAVCAGEGLPPRMIAPLLSRLVEQSQLQVGPERFWLLETLRTYAAEQLDEETTGRLRLRHARDTADRLAAAAQQLWTPDEAEAVAAITSLLTDLHAAWRYARDQAPELAARLAADVFGFAYVRQRLDLLRWSLALSSRDSDHDRLPDVLAAAAAAAWAAGHLDQARRLTELGIQRAGGAHQPAAASAIDVSADLAMFEGRTDEAVDRYRLVAGLHRRADNPMGVLLAEIAEMQAASYGPSWRDRLPGVEGLVGRARATRNPTTMAFACFAAGEAVAQVDGDRALAYYAEAIDHGTAADSRLFVTLARDATAALLAVRGGPAVEHFVLVLREWQQMDNEAGQWAALRNLAMLLARLGLDEDAVVITGAVEANKDARWHVAPHVGRFEPAMRSGLRTRLGDAAFDAALAAGGGLSLVQTMDRARTALEAARRADASEPYAS